MQAAGSRLQATVSCYGLVSPGCTGMSGLPCAMTETLAVKKRKRTAEAILFDSAWAAAHKNSTFRANKKKNGWAQKRLASRLAGWLAAATSRAETLARTKKKAAAMQMNSDH